MGLVISEQRLVPAWLKAARHLEAHGRECRNLMLEVERPQELTAGDRVVVDQVDAVLKARNDGLSIATVATTIFPQAMYRRHGPDAFVERFLKVMKRAKKEGTWGTYAMRILQRRGRVPGATFNPLEQIVDKLKRASTDGNGYRSNYELGVHLAEDLDETEYEVACELPTYESATDGAKVANIPCLSHLTFKMTKDGRVDLTAIYRSHHYAARALGNLVGLSHLLGYVAKESGLEVGTLTCISTHAVLDLKTWGGVARGKALLSGLNIA
jgi:hypothetical protein